MVKKAAYLITIFLLFSIASAGTVTLSGGCISSNTLTNTTAFKILNSGNDTAVQMVITPIIQNAESINSIYTISSLGPGSNFTINVTAENITTKGTSGAYLLAAYQQGGSVFTAVFPCLMSFGAKTESQLLLVVNSSTALNGSAKVKVSVYNAGKKALTVNVSLATPTSFSYESARYQQLVAQPSATTSTTFYLTIPTSVQSSYTVGAIASYIQDNLSYANFAVTVLSSSGPSKIDLSSLMLFGTAAALAVVLALIGFSLLKGKKKQA